MLNGVAVLRRRTRQSTASTSTADTEWNAFGFAGQQLMPLRDLLDWVFSNRQFECWNITEQRFLCRPSLIKQEIFAEWCLFEGVTNRGIFWLNYTPNRRFQVTF